MGDVTTSELGGLSSAALKSNLGLGLMLGGGGDCAVINVLIFALKSLFFTMELVSETVLTFVSDEVKES